MQIHITVKKRATQIVKDRAGRGGRLGGGAGESGRTALIQDRPPRGEVRKDGRILANRDTGYINNDIS